MTITPLPATAFRARSRPASGPRNNAFRRGSRGNREAVLGAGIALTLVGLLLGLIAFPFGFLPALVGLALILLYVVGLGARAGERRS